MRRESSELGVSASAVQLLLAECELGGLPTHELRKLLVPREVGLYAWSDYLGACDAIVEQLGNPQRFSELVQATIPRAFTHVLPLAPLFLRAVDFAAYAARAMDASAFLGVRYRATVLDRTRLHVQLRAEPGYALTPSLVAGVIGAFRAVATPFGPELASVRAGHEGSRVELEVSLPVSALHGDDAHKPAGPSEALTLMAVSQRRALENQHALAVRIATQEDDVRRMEERALRARREWDLTSRETEVLLQVCGGLTNKEVAAAMRRSESTIELHVTRLLRKACLSSRAALVARYFQL